jgi:hypothetical protein
MRKQELLDEEKRSRLTEMRKTGVSVKRGAEIPFGVRAIQGGVEVDGIWISRPATPNVETKHKLQSTTTLIGLDADPNKKGKMVDDARSTSESLDRKQDQRHSQSDASIFQRLTDAESLASNSNASGTPRQSQFSAPKPKHPRVVSALNEDTLRRLESHGGRGRSAYDTYVPARSSAARRPSQRSSASSSGESMESQPRSSARSGSGRSYASSHSSRMYTSRPRPDPRPTYNTGTSVSRASPEKERRDPLETSGSRTPVSPLTYSSGNQSPAELNAPEPTFGPGDMHVNRVSRRVNNGFEVLPAGTFGVRDEFRVDEDGFQEGGLSARPVRKGTGTGTAMGYTQTLRNASQNF